MKKWFWLVGLVALAGAGWGGLGWAQSYSVTGGTVAGGGGTSSGGDFSVSGTVGQNGASFLSSTNFSVAGGLWSVINVVTTPGAPTLALAQSGNNLVVSWPSTGTAGYLLLQTPALKTSPWTTNTAQISDDGTNKSVSLPLTPGNLFLRLHKP